MTGISDFFQRPINYLRISVTDRCNLRCIYCMPAGGVCPMSQKEMLTFEEILAITRVAVDLGVNKVRLTGGEPLLRSGLPRLIQMLRQIDALEEISLTTNGTLLGRYAAELKESGLERVNVSLDTLNQEKFEFLTRSHQDLRDVLESIETARSVGLNPVKINMVVISGVNDDEILEFAKKTIAEEWHVRFIELMPIAGVGTATSQIVPATDMKKRLRPLGELEPCRPKAGNGPAKYFRFPQAKGTIGFITPFSEHFCFRCNRLRLTSNGKLRLCLLAEEEIDLKQPLRKGISLAGLKKLFAEAVAKKPLRHHLTEDPIHPHRPFSQVGG